MASVVGQNPLFRDPNYNLSLKPKIHKSAFIAPNSSIIGNVEIGEFSSVWYNCVLRGDNNYIKIGERTNVQDGTIIHIDSNKYPTHIENDVTIGHGCIIHACTMRSRILIGMGAIVLDGAEVRCNTIIAAGSLVPPGMYLEPGSLYMGSPCKRVRSINEDDYRLIIESSKNYVANSILHKKYNESSSD
ncbi:gamma carbonic anhydrase family protein [bacterium]|nr:gamma carbonic anhydrase family protein [bacterium]|tara:strand:+ start:141167 stop:141730 length:564 start_codon:yes stop_codon:yes gene_type:complete